MKRTETRGRSKIGRRHHPGISRVQATGRGRWRRSRSSRASAGGNCESLHGKRRSSSSLSVDIATSNPESTDWLHVILSGSAKVLGGPRPGLSAL